MPSLAKHKPIQIELRLTSSLTPSELDQIWAVTERYVETERPVYEEKLHAMPEVGLWRTRDERTIIGVVGLDVYTANRDGRPCSVIFTSSVVLDEVYRQQNLVLRAGIRATIREKLRHPFRPTYWFFDTFSYKSYVLLAHNFAEFWPRADQRTPDDVARFVDQLARQRYGDAWSRATGVVRASGHKRLRETTAPITDRALADPALRFFNTMNPGHRDGDMLVCLAPVSLRNIMGAVVRGVRRRT